MPYIPHDRRADLANIIRPELLEKGACCLDPMLTNVPIALLMGQTFYVLNHSAALDGSSEHYDPPANIDRRLYAFGMGIEVHDIEEGIP